MFKWLSGLRREKTAKRRKPRPISLALALIFSQVLDPPTQHLIEAKESKQTPRPAPGDPPTPCNDLAPPTTPSVRRRRRPPRSGR